MVVSHQWRYRFQLHELDLDAVEDVLSYCKTLCEQGLAPRAPFWTDTKDIEAIRNRLLGFYVPREPSQVLPRHLCYFQPRYSWQHLDIELEEKDMMAFDAMLSCFQAHCREQMAQGIGGFEVHVALIDDIRELIWASPPSADE